MTITCIHMTSDMAENCPNCNPAISTAIEAPAQEPVAWGESYDGGKTFVSCTVTAGSKHHTFPLYVTPPDHLALVAAAYRDAAGVMDTYLKNTRIGYSSVVRALEELAGWLRGNILARTPADAEAHLTALLRAEYERGVLEAAATINRGGLHTSADYSDCILDLLTQEGR